MLVDIAAIILGFILLIWSADRFIQGAAATASNLNVSTLVIGLTIVGFGTSAPEMIVAAFASLDGSPAMAIGNALGSNIANIALVLGSAALIVPLSVHSRILKKELPILLAAMALAWLLMLDGTLGRIDGVVLLGSLVALLWWVTRQALAERDKDILQQEYSDEIPTAMSMPLALFWLLLGLCLLVVSSKILVWGAVNIAWALGVSELVIGLTIIAIGTSLPELATSIAGVLKKEHDIAIGNIVGSNLFNTLGVLSVPGILAPEVLEQGIMSRDMPVAAALSIALFVMAYGFTGQGRINRIEGGVLFMAFFAYQLILYFTAVR